MLLVTFYFLSLLLLQILLKSKCILRKFGKKVMKTNSTKMWCRLGPSLGYPTQEAAVFPHLLIGERGKHQIFDHCASDRIK